MLKKKLMNVGPCFGGIIVTFASWRIIFWVQVAMTGFGLILSLIFVPEIPSADAKIITTATATTTPTMKETTLRILAAFNPIHIVRLLIYPNIFLAVHNPPPFPPPKQSTY